MDSGRRPDFNGNFMDVVLRPINPPPPREQHTSGGNNIATVPLTSTPSSPYGVGNKQLLESNYSQIETIENPEISTSQILEKLKESGYGVREVGGQLNPVSSPGMVSDHLQQEMFESLRVNNAHLKKENEFLKKENEKKEFLIQDLLKKLHDSIETIRSQSDQIQKLQLLAETSTDGIDHAKYQTYTTQSTMPNNGPFPPGSASTPIKDEKLNIPPAIPKTKTEQSTLELRVTTQPPSQAVYQRILRPFPSVTIYGFNSATMCNNLFVEVNLLTQSDHDPHVYSNGHNTKGRVEDDKKALMIGGQRVQRSEAGSSPDTLVVVFRKLKILTTTAQQGGAFFLLQFVLKRYVDNTFETVEGVPCAISQPIEVFSHTLYLKGRPSSSPGVTQNAKKAKKEPKHNMPTSVATAAQALLLQKANATPSERMIVPQSITTIPAYDPIEVKDALSTLVAASVDARALP
jgi:hypothetical protein